MLGNTLLINLDRRPDRLKQVTESYFRSDLWPAVPLHRLSASDGATTPIEEYTTPVAMEEIADAHVRRRRRHHAQLTRGGVGCYLSHVRAWQVAAQSPGYTLVLEDDVTVPRKAMSQITDLIKTATFVAGPSHPWLLLLQARCLESCQTQMDGLQQPTWFWGTGGYVLSDTTATALLQMDDILPADIQIDSKLSLLAQEQRLAVFSAFVFPRNPAGTDIQLPVDQGAPLMRAAPGLRMTPITDRRATAATCSIM